MHRFAPSQVHFASKEEINNDQLGPVEVQISPPWAIQLMIFTLWRHVFHDSVILCLLMMQTSPFPRCLDTYIVIWPQQLYGRTKLAMILGGKYGLRDKGTLHLCELSSRRRYVRPY